MSTFRVLSSCISLAKQVALIVTAALLPRPPPQLVQVQVQELREALV
jgi:hypothetical protein